MAKFETFIEPFDDLSQWMNLSGVASADSNDMLMPFPQGDSIYTAEATIEQYDIEDSWVSFRFVTPGPAGDAHHISCHAYLYNLGTGENYIVSAVRDEDLGLVQINSADFSFDYELDDQPYFAFAGADDNLSLMSSIDGITWNTHATIPSPFAGGVLASLVFVGQSVGDWPVDYNIRFDSVYQFNPLVVAPTEVDKTVISTWSTNPFYLRHSSWHVHHSVFKYLEAQLETLKWTVDGEVPFGCPMVRLQETLPPEFDKTVVFEAGLVAVTLGDEPDSAEEEMGGPLTSLELPIFIDIFQDNEATTLALANDIRDILKGRIPGSSRFLDITNWASDSSILAPGYRIEFDDVTRDRLEKKKNWQVVKVTATLFFPEVVY